MIDMNNYNFEENENVECVEDIDNFEEDSIYEEMVKLFDIVNNENYMPRLEMIKEVYMIEGSNIDIIEHSINSLCELTNIRNCYREMDYIATYDHSDNLIGFFQLGSGGRKEVDFDRNIFITFIILTGAFSFAVFHNHPVESILPSQADKDHAVGLKGIGNLLDIKFKGSYIVTRNGWSRVETEEVHPFNNEKIELE